MKANEDTDRSVRIIVLLKEVAIASSPITANEISERTGLPKATVYRLCEQLLAAGLIRRQLGGRGYVPGPELVGLSQSVLASRSIYATRHAIITGVARDVGETCNLVAPDGTGMIYWDRVETEWPLRLQLPIGSRVPFHATASGKMYLACLPVPQGNKLLGEIELKAFTENTLTEPEKLRQHLVTINDQGYSLDDEEFIAGMTAIAVPVRDGTGRYVASLAVHAPKARMPIADAVKHVELLQLAAAKISSGIPEKDRVDQ
ncbi:MAG TPA: IclR family transcriptional regulator [Hyphomicrobiaceae bacterium]|nr:IclR family transcriptional regulator [Hyphomicrobiaceae bacterium]